MLKNRYLFLFIGFFLIQTPAYPVFGFLFKKKAKAVSADSLKTASKYEDLTEKASVASRGVLNVFEKKGDYFFELPDSLLGREFLVVNKLTRVPLELNEAGVNSGINYENHVLSFELDKERNKLLLRRNRPLPLVANEAAIAHAVKDNYILPLIASFDIAAYSKDSSSFVFKVNDIYNGKETSINNVFANINLGTSALSNLSRIKSIKAFSNNVAAYSELTTKVSEGNTSVFVTVEVVSSLVLLPREPMRARQASRRVGYFTTQRLSFEDEEAAVGRKRYITRWRLEPSDPQAYLRGELTNPVKPIVFYISESTPERWRPYIRRGMEDWNRAFEKAGFKNAIQVFQESDSLRLDADDASRSLFTYVASEKQNAMGPSVIDPRTGEILEADIIWWHNVVNMLQEWLTVQTGPYNPAARQAQLPDSLLGEAIRFVACHEVGHSLGLRHNMIASWAYPTDSLRSKGFTERVASTSSSIMDYARFNYVAQPADGVRHYLPGIGPYDLFAIEYGYRWFGGLSPQEENEKLFDLLEVHRDKLYKYSEAQDMRDAIDPRALSEDLGNDALRSAALGIANLKTIIPQLVAWTRSGERDQSYRKAANLYRGVINQWNGYLYHVLANIGGIYLENTSVDDGQKTFLFVEKERQQKALRFLMDEVLSYPAWLFDTGLRDYSFIYKDTPVGTIETDPHQLLTTAQAYVFWDLLANNRMLRMLANESRNGQKAFTAVEMLDQLHRHIFRSTEAGSMPTLMERSLQKGFVDALITAASASEGVKLSKKLYETRHPLHSDTGICSCSLHSGTSDLYGEPRKLDFYGSQVNRLSDVISIKRGELLRIKALLQKRRQGAHVAVRYHYDDLVLRINTALGIAPDSAF